MKKQNKTKKINVANNINRMEGKNNMILSMQKMYLINFNPPSWLGEKNPHWINKEKNESTST